MSADTEGLPDGPASPAGEVVGMRGVRVPYGSGRQPVVRAGLPHDARGKGAMRWGPLWKRPTREVFASGTHASNPAALPKRHPLPQF